MVAFGLVAVLASGQAGGWELETSVTYGCHERFTQQALHETGYAAEPPPIDAETQTLFDAVDFDAYFVDRNIYALSLMIGVRSTDLRALPSVDISRLIAEWNDPADQISHCLRTEQMDGEDGDAMAAAACRERLMTQVMMAFGSTALDEEPDPAEMEMVPMSLEWVGRVDVPLSRFYFRLGRAMHALQDSFSHCYRTPDRTRIVEVGNWIEDVTANLDVERDGPGHSMLSDDCQCTRQWGEPTYEATARASADLLAAVSGPGTRLEREQAVEAVLDAWLGYEPGCTEDNGYCQSPDPVDLAGGPCGGCSLAGAGTGAGTGPRGGAAGAMALAFLCLAAVLARPRRIGR